MRTRRVRAGEPGDWSEAPRSFGGDARLWQVVAIVAIIVATAGWTTVAVMKMNETVAQVPAPTATDEGTQEPVVASHEFPALEALLPTTVDGTALSVESWTGDAIFGDDPWSQSLTAYLVTVQKGPVDVHVAQAYDALGTLDIGVAAYQVEGVTSAALRDAMIAAWKVQYPDLVTSTSTIGGKTLTRGVFGNGLPDSYWYESGDVVFDVETTDAAMAATVLASLPPAGGPSSSPSTAPSGPPSATPSPAPSPS